MDDKYWILLLVWAIYFAIHSLAASNPAKQYFENAGVSKTGYRKAYVVFSTLTLFILLMYSSNFQEEYLIKPGGVLKYISLAIAASGTIIIQAAFKQYDLKEFIGMSQENPKGQLSKNGILSYVRHPVYSGTILVVIGYLLYIPKMSSMIITITVFLYILIGIYWEEKKLVKEFGQKYIDYKSNVPALIPRLKDVF